MTPYYLKRLAKLDFSKANLSDTNITGANVSNTVLSVTPTDDAIPDEQNHGTPDQTAERQIKRITTYTYDGKPIINQEENQT